GGVGKRSERILDLGAQTQRLATGCEEGQAGARIEESRDVGSYGHDLLEVVQHEHELPVANVIGELSSHAECSHDRRLDKLRIANRRKISERGSVLERRHDLRCRLKRQARLAYAAGASDGDEAGALVAEKSQEVRQLPLAADERCWRQRQVRLAQALERREI